MNNIIRKMVVDAHFDKSPSEHRETRRANETRSERHEVSPLDKETAEKWVAEMTRPEGGKGGRWSYQNVIDLLRSKNSDLPPVDAFVAMNMLYSDYGLVLSRFGANSPDMYYELAKAWINDDDISAGKLKTAKYYHYIVK